MVKLSEYKIFEFKKTVSKNIFSSDEAFKGTVVNRTLPSLHGG